MRLGFLTGLRAEAALAYRLSPLVRYTASRPDRTADLAWQLIRDGATALISFGVAGALAPHLRPGMLVVADEARSEGGAARPDRSLFLRLQAIMPSIVCGPVFGSDKIVATAAAKKDLHEKSAGALAVDMESHTVAAVAQDAGIPFAVLRAIADTATETIPRAALVPLRDDGTPDPVRILKSAFLHPWELPRLARLGLHYGKALGALRQLTYLRFLPETD